MCTGSSSSSSVSVGASMDFSLTVGVSSTSSIVGSNAPQPTIELIRGGSSIAVRTKAHVFHYMHAVTNQLLNELTSNLHTSPK
jgi:hypothetical protein